MQNINKINRFTWQQTMLRVKDYQKSVDYYTKNFGMTVVDTYDFPQWKFKLYFLANLPKSTSNLPKPGTEEAHNYLWNFEGTVLELTYNYGTEENPEFKYHSGNQGVCEKKRDGFGHIAFHTDDVYSLCNDLEKQGVEFKKKPDEGRMKGLAFAYDPDGYWVEILKRPSGTELAGQTTLGQTMLRVKDPKKSIQFYTEICQMKLVNEKHFDDFSLYFLATLPDDAKIPTDLTSEEACDFRTSLFNPCLELTHNHGTENDADFSYLSGNTEEPQKGFGHVGFLVDDVYQAAEEMLTKGVQFQKKPDEGGMKGLAFAKDPDGYWVELVKRGMVF